MPFSPRIRRPFRLAVLAFPLLFLPPAAGAARALEVAYRSPGEGARVARVQGDALYQDRGDPGWRYADPNFPVQSGDVFLTGASEEITLEFDGGVLVDLDRGTRLEVVDADRGPRLRLDRGAVYLVLLERRSGPDRVRVAWDGGRLLLGERGSYRLDCSGDGIARATVLRGRARVEAGGGGRYLEAGESILVDRGRFASRETSYRPGDYDDFDVATIDRYTGVFGYRPPRHFPHVLVGFWELDTHGTWIYVPAWRGYGWKPHHPGRGWRPFRQGRWRRGPDRRWCWVPAASWAYTTSHYGAWAYLTGQGWVWKPGRAYSPGRVRWKRSGNYLGWAPLGPSGKPVGPHGVQSPFLFLRAGDLAAGRRAAPLTAPPVPGEAPEADDPDALLPSLAAERAAPAPAGAAAAADEAEAAGRDAARRRRQEIRETAGAAEVAPAPPPSAGAEGDGTQAAAPGGLPIGEQGPEVTGAAPSPGAPWAAGAPSEAAGAETGGEGGGTGVTPEEAVPAVPAESGSTDVAAPDAAPAETPPDALSGTPQDGDAAKGARDAERAGRRAANEAKKQQERAARDAERAQKAAERRERSSPGSAGPAAGPDPPGASAN